MGKEQTWIIVAVALVVAVIASVATASITGNAFYNRLRDNVNANECRADNKCEFNDMEGRVIWADNVVIENSGGEGGGLTVSHDDDGDAQADTFLAVHKQDLSLATNGMMSVLLKNYPWSQFNVAYQMRYLTNGSAPDKDIQIVRRTSDGFTNTFYENVHFDEPAVFDSLTGNGTAYLCVDSVGKVFRSLTACR